MWFKVADSIAKLTAAAAIVFAAFVANAYQSKMSAITLLSEREQAETGLRAEMFANLISPIVGPYQEHEGISLEREKLLVELLSLNFHEHFECKPLMLHVERRIEEAEEESPEDRYRMKRSLRSIARRVSDRQIAFLLREAGKKEVMRLDRIRIQEFKARDSEGKESKHDRNIVVNNEPVNGEITSRSPDGSWKIYMTVRDIDAENQRVRIFGRCSRGTNDESKNGEDGSIPLDFVLTRYDFPFTDNTLLGDGNRFALILDSVDTYEYNQEERSSVEMKLLWFPKDYFTPRERPVNYSKFREAAGIEVAK